MNIKHESNKVEPRQTLCKWTIFEKADQKFVMYPFLSTENDTLLILISIADADSSLAHYN